MKNKIKNLIIAVIVIAVVFVVVRTQWHYNIGNKDILDPYSNIWTYAEVKMPGDTIKEGKVKNWADYSSDAVKIVFEDGTEILTSYNCAVLSKNKIKR